MTGISKSTLCVSAGAAMLLAVGGPAAAATLQTEGLPPLDPLAVMDSQILKPDQFLLYSNNEAELLRYNTPRDTEICVKRTRHDTVDGAVGVIPVRVTWDNNVATVNPGNCMSFDAKSVKIRPATHLPDDEMIEGTFSVNHH